MKGDSVLLKLLYPKIERALSDRRIQNGFKEIVSSYVDRNMSKLSEIGPVRRTTFLDDEMNKLYSLMGINPEEVKGILKESSYIASNWQIMNNPFNSVMAFTIRYFKIKKMNDMMGLAIVYLTLSMYPSLHFKYFKYEPNANIMAYTINNLSNKFKIKNSKTIYKALVDTTVVSDATMSKRLIRGTDKDITDYVQAYKTRLNSLIKKIANVFYENEKKGLYLNTDTENNDPDNYRMADNDTQLTERLSDAVCMNLSVNGPNMQIVKLSAKLSDISVNELRNTVSSICDDKTNRDDIKKITAAIIYLFINDSRKTKELIGTNDFVYFCLGVYKRANTTDVNIVKIKEILDKWLSKYSESYKRSQRVATLNNFRRGLFTFMVFTIQQNAK